MVGLAPGSKSRALAAEAGLRVADVADAVRAADVVMILVPDTVPEGGLRRGDRAEPATRSAADVRPRLQHPVRADRPARDRRRRDDRAQGSGSPAPLGLPRRGRRAGPVRRPSRRVGDRARPRPRLRPGDRLDPGRRPRDDLRRGDRDRPVRRAVRPVRRDRGAGQDGVRDARRGRLPAGARLLRDDARAEAHRRPAVPRRAQLHALQRQRHGRVRRLRVGTADHRRPRPGDHAAGPQGDPGRDVRRALDRRERFGPGGVRAPAPGRSRPPDRAGRGRLRAQMPFLDPIEVVAGQAQASATTPGAAR